MSKCPLDTERHQLKNSAYVKIITAAVVIGSFPIGLGSFWDLYDLNEPMLAYLVNFLMFMLFLIMGAFTAAACITYYGRRRVLVLSILPILPTLPLLALFWYHVGFMLLARLCSGFAIGAYMLISTIYMAEISVAKNRGRYVSIIGLCYWMGCAICAIMYNLMHFAFVGFALLVLIFMILCLVFLPGSPYFVAQLQEYDFAAEILCTLRCGDHWLKQREFMAIRKSVNVYCHKTYWNYLLRIAQWERIVMVVGTVFFTHFSGYHLQVSNCLLITQQSQPLMILARQITSNVFLGEMLNKYFIYIAIFLVALVGFLISFCSIDKCGRIWLLIISEIGAIISLALSICNYHFFFERNAEMVFLLVGAILTYYLFYFMGFGFVPFVVISEIFQQHNKVVFCAFGVSWYYLCLCVANLTTRLLISYLGIMYTAGVFIIVDILGILFFIFVLVDCKRLTLFEIQQDFDGFTRKN